MLLIELLKYTLRGGKSLSLSEKDYNIANIVLHYREIPNHNIGLKYNT